MVKLSWFSFGMACFLSTTPSVALEAENTFKTPTNLDLSSKIEPNNISPLLKNSPVERSNPPPISGISMDKSISSDELSLKTSSFTAPQLGKEIVEKLRTLYKKKLLPIERKFHLSLVLPTGGEIQDAEFTSNPMVLLVGQYSTGKTTFIRHLIGGKDFPGIHIGPEPTTDKFIALIHGNDGGDTIMGSEETEVSDDGGNSLNAVSTRGKSMGRYILSGKSSPYEGKIIKGNSLTVIPELPFSSLSSFGTAFLSHFEGSICPAPLLQHVTLIDTPGILSGEKQRLARSYDFVEVSRWFADRADLILLLFDAHKLDISDELKEIIEKIRPHNDDKIRCVLNKADQVNREQLVRVYGALMWSMGKIFLTPENVRVYTGSFWNRRLVHNDFKDMFQSDEKLLTDELKNLPMVAAERKVNEFVKRVRLVKVYVCILVKVRRNLRGIFGMKQWTKEKLIIALKQIFMDAKIEYGLSEGDMPDVESFAEKLLAIHDFNIFPGRLDKRILSHLDELIQTDIPELVEKAGGVEISSSQK